jgi:thiamine-monophosphate kinase
MTSAAADARARPGEFALIAELFAPLARNAPGAFGLTDDAAVFTPPAGQDLVVTTDAVVESVHFLKDDPPATIAQKALRVNLSDLAAKGAVPAGYFLDLVLPAWPDRSWLESFAAGLAADQASFGLALMGGDTTSTPGPLTLAITAFGLVPGGAMIRRAGARPGDLAFVSGTIGDAGGGLSLLLAGADRAGASSGPLVERYRRPLPRLALGQALRGQASAALDVSDGLVGDFGHLAAASGVRVEIDSGRIPLSAPLQALWGSDLAARMRAATAGDDYELAFTAPPERRGRLVLLAAETGVPITAIGRVVAGEGVAFLDAEGRDIALPHKGFAHF